MDKANDLNSLISRKLKAFLETNDRRAAYVAKKSGIPESVIHRILYENGNVTLATLSALAEAMEISPAELLRPEEGARVTVKQAITLMSETLASMSREVDPLLARLKDLEAENEALKKELEDLKIASEYERLKVAIDRTKEALHSSSSASEKNEGSSASSKYKARTKSK